MAVTEQSIRFAVKNIARYGDTDVFPFPSRTTGFMTQKTTSLSCSRT